MFTLLGGALIGAYLSLRGRPRVRIKRTSAIGSVTGSAYFVEEIGGAGFYFVSRPGALEAVLERAPGKGFVVRRARGTPEALSQLALDFRPLEKGSP